MPTPKKAVKIEFMGVEWHKCPLTHQWKRVSEGTPVIPSPDACQLAPPTYYTMASWVGTVSADTWDNMAHMPKKVKKFKLTMSELHSRTHPFFTRDEPQPKQKPKPKSDEDYFHVTAPMMAAWGSIEPNVEQSTGPYPGAAMSFEKLKKIKEYMDSSLCSYIGGPFPPKST